LRVRAWVFLALGILALLHHDFWLWQRSRIVLGLPVGLWYHIVYCLLVSAVMAVVVRRGRPRVDEPA
jgi:membrane protein implicated in regulation of membrane protease activity